MIESNFQERIWHPIDPFVTDGGLQGVLERKHLEETIIDIVERLQDIRL